MRTMIDPKTERTRLQMLLSDTVTLLCKSGLHYTHGLQIQGLLGVTVDSDQVFIVHFNETISVEESPAKALTSNLDNKPSVDNKTKSPIHLAGSVLKSGTPEKRLESTAIINLKNKQEHPNTERTKSNGASAAESVSVAKTIVAERTSQEPRCCENTSSETDASFKSDVIAADDNRISHMNFVTSGKRRSQMESNEFKSNEFKVLQNCSIKIEPFDDEILNESGDMTCIVGGDLTSIAGNTISNDLSTFCQDSSSSMGELSYGTSGYFARDLSLPGNLKTSELAPEKLTVRRINETGAMGITRCRRSFFNRRDGSVSETLGEGEFHYCSVAGCNKKFLHRRHLLRHQTFKHGRVPTRRKGMSHYTRKSAFNSRSFIAPEDFMEGLVNMDDSIKMENCLDISTTLIESSASELSS